MRNIFGNPVNTISDLKKVYQDGVPYNCKYRIEINFPPDLQTTLNAETLNIACQSAEIPKASVKTQKISYRGRPIVLKGQLSFDESFKITVQEQGHFQIRKELQKWIDIVDNLDGTSQSQYTIDEVYLYHLDTYGNPTLKTTFYGVFLTELGAIQLSDKGAEAITYDCSFAFSTYETTAL